MYAQLDTRASGEVSRVAFSIPHIGSWPVAWIAILSILWVLLVLTERRNPVLSARECHLFRAFIFKTKMWKVFLDIPVTEAEKKKKARIKNIEYHRCHFSNKGVS